MATRMGARTGAVGAMQAATTACFVGGWLVVGGGRVGDAEREVRRCAGSGCAPQTTRAGARARWRGAGSARTAMCAGSGVAVTPPQEGGEAAVVPPAPLTRLLDADLASPRFVLVGGKGGVGKTSTSAAIALQTARAGFKTLVVSTDPAHSLGDALQIPLASHRAVRVPLEALPEAPPSIGGSTRPANELYAMEIDTERAAASLRALLARLSGNSDSDGGGGKRLSEQQRKLVEQLGLAEFGEVFSSLPPGADELVALTELLALAEDDEYERVIIDTAPTGHTLRMLAFPDFVDVFLEKALRLREKVAKMGTVMNVVRAGASMLGGGGGGLGIDATDVERAVTEIEAFRVRLSRLSELLRNPASCEFVVVTIATKLAADESERLVEALTNDGVWVRFVVINQLLSPSSRAAMDAFVQRVTREQLKSIERLEAFCAEAETSSPGTPRAIHLVRAPLFDAEIRDMYALRAFAGVALGTFEHGASGADHDLSVGGDNRKDSCEYVLVGGKGGVGKTTTSSALGVKFADAGLRTLLVSTDPAHSLGDALEMRLDKGEPQRVTAYDEVAASFGASSENGMLWAMEIDTQAAVAEFRRVVAAFGESGAAGSGVLKELGVADLATILDNTPPGIDELLALVKVVQLVRNGEYDRVVIDTAPTGHTLRLLAFPAFLDGLLGKVLKLKRRIDGVLNVLSGNFLRKGGGEKDSAAKGGGTGADTGAETLRGASAKMERFRDDMSELRALLRNPRRTQFAVVTIPTALAAAESERLIAALETERVRVRNVVINQCLPPSAGNAFAERRSRAQDTYVRRLTAMSGAAADLDFALVPYSDVELRGIFGLAYLADMLFSSAGLNAFSHHSADGVAGQ